MAHQPRHRPTESDIDGQKSQRHQEAAARAASPASKARQHVYFFGNGKADGNRSMKDLLGGKGVGPRRDDQRRAAGAARLHDLHRGLQHLLPGEGEDSRRRSIARSTSNVAEAREGRRRDARLDRQPAARLGPLGREVLDARHDGHHPQPRAERRCGRRAEARGRRTAASRSTATAASSRCSATSCSRFRRTRSSTSSTAVKKAQRREARHRARRGGAARGGRALQGRSCRSGPAAPSRRTRPSS